MRLAVEDGWQADVGGERGEGALVIDASSVKGMQSSCGSREPMQKGGEAVIWARRVVNMLSGNASKVYDRIECPARVRAAAR